MRGGGGGTGAPRPHLPRKRAPFSAKTPCSRAEPLFCESSFRGLQIAANRRFEAIRANRSRIMKKGFFFKGRQTRGFADLDLSFLFLSFFVLFCPFWDFPNFSGIFPICSGMVRGFSRFVLFLYLGLLRAPTRNSPDRVRDTIWTFPEKAGNTRVWRPTGLASLNFFFCPKNLFGLFLTFYLARQK